MKKENRKVCMFYQKNTCKNVIEVEGSCIEGGVKQAVLPLASPCLLLNFIQIPYVENEKELLHPVTKIFRFVTNAYIEIINIYTLLWTCVYTYI